MGAGKYISEEDLNPAVTFNLNESQFGNIEITATLMLAKESGRAQGFNITVGGSVVSAPVFYKNRIYFGCCDKNFYCVDLEGKEIWRFPTGGQIVSTASIYDDIVYVGSFDGNVYAVSADTGEEIWRFCTNGKVMTVVTMDKRASRLYFGSEDGNMYALDKKGKLAWKFPTNGPVSSQPVADEKNIYFGSFDKNFYALDKDGKMVWRSGTNSQIISVPALHGDIVCFGSFDHNLYALDKETGGVLWKFEAKDAVYHVAILNETVYFGSRDFYFYAVTLDGKLKWKFHTNDMVPDLPAVQNGVVYFGSGDFNFYALDEETGKKLWKFETGGPLIQRAVSIRNGVIYFGSWDCNVYAITTDGELVWKFRTSLGTQSTIDVEAAAVSKTFEIKWVPEAGEEKKKYESEDSIGHYDINMSHYIVEKDYIPKKGKYR